MTGTESMAMIDAQSEDAPTARPPGSSRPPSKAAPGHAVLVALRRIIRATDLHSKQLTKTAGLTIPQVVVLQAIRDLGEVTTRQIAQRVTLSQGTVTTILDRLERRMLIERYRSATDRRIVHTRLTAKGRVVLRQAPPLLHERFLTAFAALPVDEQDRIVATLHQVAGMMGADQLDAAPLLDTAPADTP